MPSRSSTTQCSLAHTRALDQQVKRRCTCCQEAPKASGSCRQVAAAARSGPRSGWPGTRRFGGASDGRIRRTSNRPDHQSGDPMRSEHWMSPCSRRRPDSLFAYRGCDQVLAHRVVVLVIARLVTRRQLSSTALALRCRATGYPMDAPRSCRDPVSWATFAFTRVAGLVDGQSLRDPRGNDCFPPGANAPVGHQRRSTCGSRACPSEPQPGRSL